MKKLTYLFLCLLIGTGLATAQTTKITGTVVSAEDGEPIIGASVMVKGNATVGTVTNFDGVFNLDVPSSAKTMVISFVGMEAQEVAIKPNLKIVMKASAEALDEVVVVAYGTAKKSSLTGSLEIVKSDEIIKVSTNSFDQALQGKAAGVQVVASSGRPGAGANIKIRGTSSISAGSTPLYVIDGVPSSATDFSALNSNDIEYMSVLKDASATAIYGSRGSNGVILITTKRGNSGKAMFNVKAQFGFTTRTQDNFDMMNTREKLTYERQLGVGRGAGMSDEEIRDYKIDTDWAKELFRTGLTQSYDISMSGGTELTRFYVSAQYYSQDAIIPGSYLDRGNVRINVEHKIRENLKVGVAASGGVSKEGLVRTDRNVLNPFNYIYSANPYTRPYKDDGSFEEDPSWQYQLNLFENIANNPNNTNRLKGVIAGSLEWKIWDGIKYNTLIGMDYNQAVGYQYNKPESKLSQILGSPGYRSDSYSHRATWVFTNLLSYEKTLNEVHEVKAMVGMESQGSDYRDFSATAEGFPTGKLDAMDIGSTPSKPGGVTSSWRLLSYIASAGYTYDSKYIVDALVRRDGSSRFGMDNQFGTFWAAGLGWNMEKEAFLQDLEWINALKLRGSVGTSGNNNIGDYAAQGVYGYGSYDDQSTAYPSRLPNPELSWEKSTQVSGGFDATLLDSRLRATFDVYNRRTTDLLLDARLSQTSGFYSRIENVGELNNRGVEFSVSGDVIKNNDWTFTLSAMISTNKNKIIKLYDGNEITIGWNNLIKEGYPINTYKMVRWAGVNPANGDALYYTKDGKITNTYNGDDAVILDGNKTPDPKYFGSFGWNLGYKGIEFSGDFYFSGGNYVYNHNAFFNQSDGAQATNNQDKRMLYDQWLKPGDITNVPRQSTSNSQQMSTRFLEDASYLRLRNVTLAYTFPKNTLKLIGIEKARVFAQGLNLLTFTGFTGPDPELGTNVNTGTGATSGVLDFNYPACRTVMFGIEVSF